MKIKQTTIGSNNTVIRAISKTLDRKLKSIQREMVREESKKSRPKKITFVSVTSKVEVRRK